MAMTTLLDIATANGSDPVAGLIEEIVKVHPELQFSARTIKGLNYKTLVRTALPTVGFRDANEGYPASKSTFENRLVETYIFNPRWECDKAVADSYEDGAPAYIAIEAEGIMEASAIALCQQFYYGTDKDPKGFPGLVAAVAPEMTVDAAGAAVNGGSSLWAVKFGVKDVTWVWGEGGNLALSPLAEARITDGNGNPFTAYVQELLARPGLQVGNKFAIGRVKNLTTDADKGLTDTLVADLIAKFPAGHMPDAMFCSRRSLAQLRSKRTATNATGTEAPFPTEVFGIPIYPTDSISDVEPIA